MWLRKMVEVWWSTFVRSTAFRSAVAVGLRGLNVTWLSCDVIVRVADLLLGSHWSLCWIKSDIWIPLSILKFIIVVALHFRFSVLMMHHLLHNTVVKHSPYVPDVPQANVTRSICRNLLRLPVLRCTSNFTQFLHRLGRSSL
jgi:hypothetical protein